MYHLEYLDEIESDLDKLSDDVYDKVYEYFQKIKEDPYTVSQPLYANLVGYRKTYIGINEPTHRIVFKIQDKVAKIVNIVAIGERENLEVYKEAHKRITNKK